MAKLEIFFSNLQHEGPRVAVLRSLHHALGVPGEITQARDSINRHLRKLHDDAPGKPDQAGLIARAEAVFDTRVLRRDSLEMGQFRELDRFRDDFRFLAFSEGRGQMGEWLFLQPAASEASSKVL